MGKYVLLEFRPLKGLEKLRRVSEDSQEWEGLARYRALSSCSDCERLSVNGAPDVLHG